MQYLRGIDGARRQHDFGIGPHLVPGPATKIADTHRARPVKQDPVDKRPRHKPYIAARHRRFEIGVRRRPSPPLPHRHVGRPEAFLPVTVIIGRRRIACRLGRRHESVMERVVAWPAGDMKRSVRAAPGRLAAMRGLHAPEIGQDIGIAPAGGARFLPMRVVTGMAANIDHAVDRGRPADHLAARTDKLPPAKRRFRLCQIAPIIARHVHRIGQRGRHLDQRTGIAATKFENQDAPPAILAKPVGKRASRRTRSDDDVIVAVTHRATIKSRPRRVKRTGASQIFGW